MVAPEEISSCLTLQSEKVWAIRKVCAERGGPKRKSSQATDGALVIREQTYPFQADIYRQTQRSEVTFLRSLST